MGLTELASRSPLYEYQVRFQTKVTSMHPIDLPLLASYPIIKRRIAWLIGKWISNECSSPNNPTVWEILVYLMQDRGPGTDAVVRLTAAITLKECVDVRLYSQGYVACQLMPCTPSDRRLRQ